MTVTPHFITSPGFTIMLNRRTFLQVHCGATGHAAGGRSRSHARPRPRPYRRASTGTCGSAVLRCGRITPPIIRPSGAVSSTSATALWAIWPCITSIPAFYTLDLDAPAAAEAQTSPPQPEAYPEWVKACKDRRPEDAKAGFAYFGPFVEALLVGMLAVRLQKRIEWDAAEMKARNAPEANKLIRKSYRSGFGIDGSRTV